MCHMIRELRGHTLKSPYCSRALANMTKSYVTCSNYTGAHTRDDTSIDPYKIKSQHTLTHTTTQCYTLQLTATLCNTLQHTAMHYNALQHNAIHASHCSGAPARGS